MWWAGRSSPARFLVPVLLPLALPLAAWWTRQTSRTARAVTLLLLAASLCLTAALVLVDRGALIYNSRDGHALWLLAASPSVNLTLRVAQPVSGRAGSGLARGRRVARRGGTWVDGAAPRRGPLSQPPDRGLRAWSARPCSWLPAARALGGRSRLARLGTPATGWSPSLRAHAKRGALVFAHRPSGSAVSREFADGRSNRRRVATPRSVTACRAGRQSTWRPAAIASCLASGLNVSGAVSVALGRPDRR